MVLPIRATLASSGWFAARWPSGGNNVVVRGYDVGGVLVATAP